MHGLWQKLIKFKATTLGYIIEKSPSKNNYNMEILREIRYTNGPTDKKKGMPCQLPFLILEIFVKPICCKKGLKPFKSKISTTPIMPCHFYKPKKGGTNVMLRSVSQQD